MASNFYSEGHVVGAFAKQPSGIVLHGTRSGQSWGLAEEFASTVAWAKSPNNPYGWNVTVGPGVYATHMRADQHGLNCGTRESKLYLACEFCQPLRYTPITDEQVATLAAWYRAEVLPQWPKLTPDILVMPTHPEMPQGKADGKDDPFPRGDQRTEDLRARIYAALMPTPTDIDTALQREYERNAAMLGAKRFKGKLDRPYYQGDALFCQRGVVGPNPVVTATVREGTMDDLITYLEGANVLTRY
jgi:hypothetical protein